MSREMEPKMELENGILEGFINDNC